MSGSTTSSAVRWIALAVAVGAIAPSCKDDPPPPIAVARPTAATLIAPGPEPREPIRYALTVGARQRVTMAMHLAMKVEAAQSPIQPLTAPGLRVVVALTVDASTPSGGARCGFVLEDVDLADLDKATPALVGEMRKGIPALLGAKGQLTVEPDGTVHDLALEVPDALGSELGQFVAALRLALAHLAVPLPLDPVGVGASWEAAETIEQGGIRVRQKALFELVAREGTRARLRLQLSQTADRQAAALPGLPPGVSTEIVAFDSAGGGEVEIELGRPSPTRQRVDVTTAVSFRLKRGTETQTMSLSSDSGFELDAL